WFKIVCCRCSANSDLKSIGIADELSKPTRTYVKSKTANNYSIRISCDDRIPGNKTIICTNTWNITGRPPDCISTIICVPLLPQICWYYCTTTVLVGRLKYKRRKSTRCSSVVIHFDIKRYSLCRIIHRD